LAPSRLEITERENSWTLPVAGAQVTRCCADYAAVAVLLSNGLQLYIEGVFSYVGHNGHAHMLNPDGDATDLAPILRLRRLTATDGAAFKDGRLEMGFEDGSQISVPADQRYEAWNISGPGGPDGLKIVSMPGGELAIWQDRR
jgi:hypothetical protein